MNRQRFQGIALAIVTCLLALPTSTAAQTGPIAAFSFNEASGSAVGDASGNGNVGAVNGATWTTGKFGSGLSFNCSNNWVTLPHAARLNLTTGMTLEAWVNPSALSIWRTVILKESSNGLIYSLYASDTANHPSGFIRRTSDVNATGSTALPLNTWTHL